MPRTTHVRLGTSYPHTRRVADVEALTDARTVTHTPSGTTITHGSQITQQNVGLAGVGLTTANLTAYTGPTTITADNTLIYRKRITQSEILVEANDVTFRECYFDRSAAVISADYAGPTSDGSGPNMIIEDCDFNLGGLYDVTEGGIIYCNFVARRNHMWGGRRGAYLQRHATLEYTLIRDLYQTPPASADAHMSPCRLGGYATFRYNNSTGRVIEDPPSGASASLTMYGEHGPVEHNLIEHNWFGWSSGSTSTYGGCESNKQWPHATYVTFNDNIYQRRDDANRSEKGPPWAGGYYFTAMSWEDNVGNVWTNNRYEDGLPVPPNGQ